MKRLKHSQKTWWIEIAPFMAYLFEEFPQHF